MKVLVFAPHPDDEVLGVGGTIAKRASDGHDVYVCVVTKGKKPVFDEKFSDNVQEECRQAGKVLGVRDTIFLDFPAVMLENVPRYEFNGKILDVVQIIAPDEVYIPHRGDMQIDHKMVVDATMVALRPKYINPIKRIYTYETLSETGWDIPNTTNEFIPTVYENITKSFDKKEEALKKYKSQLAEYPNPRSLKAVRALAMYRGSTVGVDLAEAFCLVREIKA